MAAPAVSISPFNNSHWPQSRYASKTIGSTGKNERTRNNKAAPTIAINTRTNDKSGAGKNYLAYGSGKTEFGTRPAKFLRHGNEEGAYYIVRHAHGNELREESRKYDPVTIVETIMGSNLVQSYSSS